MWREKGWGGQQELLKKTEAPIGTSQPKPAGMKKREGPIEDVDSKIQKMTKQKTETSSR